MSSLGQLGLLAGAFMRSRQDRRDRERSRQEELAHRRALLELQERDRQWRQQQQEQEAARRRAEPFVQGLYGPGSADFLANLAARGRQPVEDYLQSAAQAFEAAGIPFDPGAYLRRTKAPGVGLSGIGAGSQAPPVDAPPEGLGMLSPGVADGTAAPPSPLMPPGTPVPRFQRMPPGVAGPPTPLTALPDERLARLFGGLPEGLAGPPAPVSLMPPLQGAERDQEVFGQAAPAAPPVDLAALLGAPAGAEDENPYLSMFVPGHRTRIMQQRADADSLAKQVNAVFTQVRARKTAAEADLIEQTMAPRIAKAYADLELAQARGDVAAADAALKRVNAGLVELRKLTEAARPGLIAAQVENLRDMPGSRAAGRAVQKYGIDTRAEQARQDRESRERVAARQLAAKQAGAAAKASGALSPQEQKVFNESLRILTAGRVDPDSKKIVFDYDDQHRDRAAEGLRRLGKKAGVDLTGVGLEDFSSSGEATGGKAAVGALMGDLAGGAAPRPTQAQVDMIAGWDAATYAREYRAASPADKKLLEAARNEAKRRGLLKGGKR